jgi:HAD superfamily hydrolase (TIGR01509 family)
MKAVIFDVDGTLIDSVDSHAKAWQEAFEHFGHSLSFDEVRSQIGKGGDQLMPVFLSKAEVKAKGKEIEKFRGHLFKAKYLDHLKAFSNVRDLFQRLLADGWKLALASSAKEDELKIYKKICRITDLLDTETSSEDAHKSKPHPDIFQAAMERLGNVEPEDCVVVGDSPYDAEAASKAGIQAVGFLSGGFPKDDLRRAGYKVLYKDASDLLARYEGSIFSTESPRKSSR